MLVIVVYFLNSFYVGTKLSKWKKYSHNTISTRTSLIMSVMIMDGATPFTRILSLAHSVARLLVSWFIPPACEPTHIEGKREKKKKQTISHS